MTNTQLPQPQRYSTPEMQQLFAESEQDAADHKRICNELDKCFAEMREWLDNFKI